MSAGEVLTEENIVLIEGRISIRDEEKTTIIAQKITNFGEKKQASLIIDITNLNEESKEKLRGAIKYFNGEKNNIAVKVKDGEELKPCGAIYCNDEILKFLNKIAQVKVEQ